jgi:hypothetical protein
MNSLFLAHCCFYCCLSSIYTFILGHYSMPMDIRANTLDLMVLRDNTLDLRANTLDFNTSNVYIIY